MNAIQLMNQLNAKLRLVNVKFKDAAGKAIGQEYTYKTENAEIVVGDSVVVKSPYTGMTVVEVTSIPSIAEMDFKLPFTLQNIVCRVDVTEYEAMLEREVEISTQLATLQLRQKRTKALNDLRDELGLAEDDAEFNALLAKLSV